MSKIIKLGEEVFGWVKKHMEILLMIIVIASLFLSLFAPTVGTSKLLIATQYALGGIGAFYAICAISWFLFKRVKFDWVLINGHFLRKVCLLVLLTPFVITSIVRVLNIVSSPKELAYEETLYECHDKELPCELKKNQASPNLFWSVYYQFIDPGNQGATTTENGRKVAAVVAILGIFLLNGLLVSSIIGWIDSRKEKWLKGEVKYNGFLKLRSHYIIIGGNDVVGGVVKQIFERIDKEKSWAKPYILIQTSCEIECFRRELFSDLTTDQQQRVIIYYGSRTSQEDIAKLYFKKAEEVYILGEEAYKGDTHSDDIESYHDTINIECLKLISEAIKDIARFYEDDKNDKRLVCRVMFEYQTTFNIYQVTDINKHKIKFLPFNYYEMWAQKVLICQELEYKTKCKYLPLEGFEGIKSDDNSFVHFVIVGMSRMGVAMAIEAAHLAHYPNFETKEKRTRITFIDADMDREKHFFMGRFKEMFSLARYRDVSNTGKDLYSTAKYPWINPLEDPSSPYYSVDNYLGEDFIDVEWEFLNGVIAHSDIQQYLVDAAANKDAKLTIAICLPENNRAIATAAYLPDSVYQSTSTLQVLVYQRLNDDVLSQISQNNPRYCEKLKAFGMASKSYDASLVEISERISESLTAAYNQYGWEQIQERCKADCFLEEDYGLSEEYVFEKYPDIKAEAVTWINDKISVSYFSDVKEDFKKLKKSLKEALEKKEPENTQNESGKSNAAKMWSNHYNIYSMWTKFRCVRLNCGWRYNPLFIDFSASMLDELGKVEHNRWIVEQLLLRYCPLTHREQTGAKVETLCSSSAKKNVLKKNFAHLDICSNAVLDKVDYKMSELDKKLVAVLPGEYRKYKEEKRCKTNK